MDRNPRLSRVFGFCAAGMALVGIGLASVSTNDPVPYLVVEGLVIAAGCFCLYGAARTLLRQLSARRPASQSIIPDREPVAAAPVERQTYIAPTPVIQAPKPVAPVRNSLSASSAAIVSAGFVERRRGDDRRQNDRRQNISWSVDADRMGPGRRRNNGRRKTDRYPQRTPGSGFQGNWAGA